jgi:hypothetical protein
MDSVKLCQVLLFYTFPVMTKFLHRNQYKVMLASLGLELASK